MYNTEGIFSGGIEMRILVQFCVNADIIECPAFILNDLKSYQNEFTEWLYDKTNDHAYWMYKDGEKYGCSYRSEAFVEWLNKFILDKHEEKAKVVEQSVDEDGLVCRAEYPKDITALIHTEIESFRKWLINKNSEGICKEEEYKKKYGMRKYIGHASADWINSFILNERNEKAYVIDKQMDYDEMKAMPKIFF